MKKRILIHTLIIAGTDGTFLTHVIRNPELDEGPLLSPEAGYFPKLLLLSLVYTVSSTDNLKGVFIMVGITIGIGVISIIVILKRKRSGKKYDIEKIEKKLEEIPRKIKK